MNPILNELQEHIGKGRRLLSEVPSKIAYAQQERAISKKHSTGNVKSFSQTISSHAQSQIDFLKREFERKKSVVSRKYDDWYSSALSVVQLVGENNYVDSFVNSKNEIEIQNKISKGTDVLQSIVSYLSNNIEKQDEIQRAQVSKAEQKKNAWLSLINQGENDSVEFKSSLRWDFKGNNLNKHLEIPVIKTVAAFLNSKGGTLFIGVDDSKDIVGLSADYPTLKRQDGDGFIQYMLQILNHALGKEFNRFISMHIASIDDKDVCVVEVQKSDIPVFMKHNNKEEFYIRASLSSQPLSVRETVEYVKMHFKDYLSN